MRLEAQWHWRKWRFGRHFYGGGFRAGPLRVFWWK
jgi:hypothetical protein